MCVKFFIIFVSRNNFMNMKVTFGDKKLEKAAKDERKCYKELGQDRGERYLKRLNALYSANTLEDVRYLPGRFHELTENRKGHWACDLDHPYRLIFKPHEDPIPEDENHKYIWAEILGVEIEEIVDYH